MAKRDEFRLDITANDQASGKIDEVAGKLEGLNAAATVSIDAEDNASETIDEVTQEVEALDEETAEPTLSADDEASEVVGDVTDAVETLDGETAEATLTADDEASGTIDGVAGALDGIDGTTAEATVTVDDSDADVGGILGDLEEIDGTDAEATVTVDDSDADVSGILGDLESIDGTAAEATVTVDDSGADNIDTLATDLESIDGETFEATVDVDDSGAAGVDDIATDLESIDGSAVESTLDVTGSSEAAEATGEIVGNLSALTGSMGLGALATAALGAVAGNAAQQALDIQALVDATGGSLDQMSRLVEVWELAGGTKDNLERMVGRVFNTLQQTPALVDQLGIHFTQNTTPFQAFVDTITALNSGQLTLNDRLALATDLFGSKGVLILNDLQTRVGDIHEGMDAVSDIEIITPADVENAHKFVNSMDAVQDSLGAMARALLPTIASSLEGVVPIVEGIGGALDLILPDIGTGIEELDALESQLSELYGSREGTAWSDDTIEAWRALKADLADNGEIDSAGDVLAMFADEAGVTEEQVLALAGAQDEGGQAAADAAALIQEEADAEAAAAEAAAAHQQAIDDQIASLEAQKSALEEATSALDDKIDAERRSVDAFYAEEVAAKKAQEAEDEYYATNEDGTFVIEDREEAVMNVVEAQERLADSVVDLAAEEAAANGTTMSRVEMIDLENRSYMSQATNLSGPLRDAVLAHVLRINGIPETKITDILTDTNPNNLAQTQALLDGPANKRRVAAYTADVNDASVADLKRQLDTLASPRTVYFAASGPGTRGGGRLAPRAVATGDPFTSEGLYLAGEYGGPELIDLPTGARVYNPTQTAEMLDGWGGGGGNTYVTTYNVPSGTTAREALKATRRYGRIQAA